MFGALKNKLKQVVSSFSKKVEAEVVEEKKSEIKEEKPAKETIKQDKSIKEKKIEKGLFSKIKEKVTTTSLSESKFEELFWDLEVELMENNVAVEVIEKIKEDLKLELTSQPLKRKEVEEIIKESLTKSLDTILSQPTFDFISQVRSKKPFVICFIGINGSGKTTTIAKIVNLIQKNKMSCVIAASDTFRAAAIEQIKTLASKLDVKVIAHEYGSDPAAVAFDAIKHAEAQHINCVLIDTAGRLHANKDLMNELKKIIRVAKPDLKIFIGESITGNDCVEQAREFNDEVGIDAIILSKADVDEKGGAAISISYITKKPILYLGNGQELNDLKSFDKQKILSELGLK